MLIDTVDAVSALLKRPASVTGNSGVFSPQQNAMLSASG
jgi:hypothetical protein